MKHENLGGVVGFEPLEELLTEGLAGVFAPTVDEEDDIVGLFFAVDGCDGAMQQGKEFANGNDGTVTCDHGLSISTGPPLPIHASPTAENE